MLGWTNVGVTTPINGTLDSFTVNDDSTVERGDFVEVQKKIMNLQLADERLLHWNMFNIDDDHILCELYKRFIIIKTTKGINPEIVFDYTYSDDEISGSFVHSEYFDNTLILQYSNNFYFFSVSTDSIELKNTKTLSFSSGVIYKGFHYNKDNGCIYVVYCYYTKGSSSYYHSIYMSYYKYADYDMTYVGYEFLKAEDGTSKYAPNDANTMGFTTQNGKFYIVYDLLGLKRNYIVVYDCAESGALSKVGSYYYTTDNPAYQGYFYNFTPEFSDEYVYYAVASDMRKFDGTTLSKCSNVSALGSTYSNLSEDGTYFVGQPTYGSTALVTFEISGNNLTQIKYYGNTFQGTTDNCGILKNGYAYYIATDGYYTSTSAYPYLNIYEIDEEHKMVEVTNLQLIQPYAKTDGWDAGIAIESGNAGDTVHAYYKAE